MNRFRKPRRGDHELKIEFKRLASKEPFNFLLAAGTKVGMLSAIVCLSIPNINFLIVMTLSTPRKALSMQSTIRNTYKGLPRGI